jgi:hypothetical protein
MRYLRKFNENADLHSLRQEDPNWLRVRQDHPNASDEQIDMMVGLKGEEEKKDINALRQEHPTWMRVSQDHPNASPEQIDKMVGL